MPKRKQSSSVLSIVAYTPPQLYVGVEWYIGFMAQRKFLVGKF